MCGRSKEDEGINLDLAEGQSGDMENEPTCSRPAKAVLFILNIIIWLGSCALLAFGIFALVERGLSFTSSVLDGNLLMTGAVVLILVGGLGFVISFIGCCGAITSNKCLIMTYVIVLGILLAILLVGGILGALFTSQLQGAAMETMRKSLKKYDRQNLDAPTAKAWDAMQRVLKCCGVMMYKDWGTYNTDFDGSSPKIPESCCDVDSNGQPLSGCTSANDLSKFYSADDQGCHAKLLKKIHMYTPIVGIVGAIVAFFMILGFILGIIAYQRL